MQPSPGSRTSVCRGVSLRDLGVVIVTVSEKGIERTMRHVWERMKIIIEPSSAVAITAVLGDELDVAGKRVGVILSGENVDLERLSF